MQYMGGKSRIAQSIADIISMTGGGNMRYQGGKSRIAQDIASAISVRGGGLLCQPFLRQLRR